MKVSNLWARLTELIKKINGVSTPLGGISWMSTESERIIARRVITFLEDRRALTIGTIPTSENDMVAIGTMNTEYCIESVLEIRKFLTDQLSEVDEKSPLAIDIGSIRDACRKFVDVISMLDASRRPLPPPARGYAWFTEEGRVFDRALLELKIVTGKHLLNISERFDIKLQGDLDLFFFAKARD